MNTESQETKKKASIANVIAFRFSFVCSLSIFAAVIFRIFYVRTTVDRLSDFILS